MQKKLQFQIDNSKTLLSLSDIFGFMVNSSEFPSPQVGNTFRILNVPNSSKLITPYQNKIYIIQHVHSEIVISEGGQLLNSTIVTLKTIRTSIEYFKTQQSKLK